MKKETVSVIVTTKNESLVIERLLRSILNQTYKNIEIILVDNNSTDKTVIIAKKYPTKIFNFGPERSAQRNYGAKKATGDYLLILDADMELTPKVIEECVEKISDNPKIGGLVIPEESIASNFWEKVKAFERSFYNESGNLTSDAARFFSRKIFLEVGGYDETITGPEDWDLPEVIIKKGYIIDRIKAKIFHYERIKSLLSLGKKKYYYALKAHRYMDKQNISMISPKTVYFLRPVFYKNWRKLISNPILSIAMFLMFSVEMIGGGLGFLRGKINKL